jgi:hypothetical protein
MVSEERQRRSTQTRSPASRGSLGRRPHSDVVRSALAKRSLLALGRRALDRARASSSGISSTQLESGTAFNPRVTVMALRTNTHTEVGDGGTAFWCIHVLSGRMRVRHAGTGRPATASAFPGDLLSGTDPATVLAEADTCFLLISAPPSTEAT